MKRIITASIVIDDEANGQTITDADLRDGLRARLDEFYPTDDGYPLQPSDVQITLSES